MRFLDEAYQRIQAHRTLSDEQIRRVDDIYFGREYVPPPKKQPPEYCYGEPTAALKRQVHRMVRQLRILQLDVPDAKFVKGIDWELQTVEFEFLTKQDIDKVKEIFARTRGKVA